MRPELREQIIEDGQWKTDNIIVTPCQLFNDYAARALDGVCARLVERVYHFKISGDL